MKCLFCSVFVEKGVIMFSLCLYSHRDRKPRHTGPPQKGPFQDQFFTKNSLFWLPRTPIHPNTSLTVFGWNRNPLLSLRSSVKWFFAIFQNSQKWLIVPIPANQFGLNRNFWPKMAIFKLFKKKSKKSLLNYYTSITLWFLFQPNTVNEVFGWNRNRYTFIAPIPAKRPVYMLWSYCLGQVWGFRQLLSGPSLFFWKTLFVKNAIK